MTELNHDLDARLLAEMREDFLTESQEILDRLGPLLAQLEQGSTPDLIDAIFRDIHTLKGTASFVGLGSIRSLAHKMEDVFGALRAGQVPVTPVLIDIALAGVQQLTMLRNDVADGGSGEADIAPLMARLGTVLRSPEALNGQTQELTPAASSAAEATPGATQFTAASTLRVSVEALDTLMVLVGELITARNALIARTERLQDEALTDTTTAISRLTGQLQTAVTSMRLVPVERLFTRFVPVVRNLARERGKQVRLVIEGGGTPLDRAVSEQMYDPLIHLLRNAVEHGLEPTPDRRRAGKPEESTIRLSAERRGDDVVLQVADDGAGVNPARIRRVAVERGLLSAQEAEELSDEQATRLIFRPGFSTSSTVTDVSGRGVGLDVVMQNVRRLRGTVTVKTTAGQGTTFVIQLPLTLAILQVLLVRVGDHTYALPLHAVRETLLIEPESIKTMQRSQVVFIRNTPLPVRRPADFGLQGRPEQGQTALDSATDNRKSAVVVHLARGDEVLLVDELVGKQQVVTKPLSPYLGPVRGVEGAAILPDGSVTLILDVEGLAG